MARPKLKVRDNGWDRFKAQLRDLGKAPYTKVGVLGKNDTRPADDLGNVDLAIVLHFGDSLNNIPGRPFLAMAWDRYLPQWKAILQRGSAAYLKGKLTLKQVFDLVGQRASADVRNLILRGAGVPPPNSPLTIARKGSSRPLVDTGRLVQSISDEAVLGG